MAKPVNSLILFLLTLTVWGCTSVTPSTNRTALPEWAKSPPLDNAAAWYGVGSGYNREIAAKHALSEIASRLKVAVQSEVQMHALKNTVDGETLVNERISVVDKLSSGEVSFPGYEIQRSEELDGQAHVLVAVDRQRFVRQYSRDIEAADRSVRETLAHLRDKPPIEQYIAKEELQENAYQLLALTDLLAAADNAFANQAQSYRQRASEALSVLAAAKNRLAFCIVADAQSRYLQGAVREMFTEEQFPTTERPGRDDTLVKVASTLLHQGRDAIGGYEISIKTQITLQTRTGHILGNRRLTLYGASTMSYDYALQALADDFKRKVENEDGIFAFMGHPDSGDI